MVNEHYVQESYLRLFSPQNRGVISRYSLVEKHGGGDYYDPIEEYSVKNAVSSEDYADGLLEKDETPRAEKAMVGSLRSVKNDASLSSEDIANTSQFLAFQRDRSPKSKIFHRLQEEIFRATGRDVGDYWESVMYVDGNERYDAFQHMGWKIIENTTDLPFFVSDVPVVVYQDEFPGGVSEGFDFNGKQIFCPISPGKVLVLLDPNTFKVEPQYPTIAIDTISIHDRRVIWKLNLLQGLNAFHEIFGPVGVGELLERMIEVMCRHFPDEDYIRGNRWSTERIIEAQKSGIREAHARPRQKTIPREDQKVLTARQKAVNSIWIFDLELSFVEALRRDEPISKYWSE